MKIISQGHEVLSLFGLSSQQQALTKSSNRGFIISIVSAFFIVFVLGLVLNFAPKLLNKTTSTVSAASYQQEAVAFLPGQFINQEINRGYIGK